MRDLHILSNSQFESQQFFLFTSDCTALARFNDKRLALFIHYTAVLFFALWDRVCVCLID